jgi:membrane-bound lytic murein transglycosylase D
MKYLHLIILLLLLPVSSVFAQDYDPEYSDPDDIYYEADTLDVNEMDSTVNVEESSVMEMLDMISNISYFRDVYLDVDSSLWNPYGWKPYDVPTYPDSIYAQRIRALARETNIPLTFNARVKAYIDLYACRKRQQCSRMLGLSYVYFPMFEEYLDKYNLPLELKYLAMVESALNPVAGSRVGAKGLWQFMYATGKDYGLQQTTLYDDRYDPMKETEAACRYLQSLYARYGDWFLVLAAYNSGPGTVNKAIMRSGGAKNYWTISRYLPRETQDYVPAFIAVTYVMNFASAHNLYPLNPGLLMHGTDTVMVHEYISFEQVSQCLGVPMNDIEFFNPQYTKKIIPGTSEKLHSLRLPMKYALRFVQLEDSIYHFAKQADLRHKEVERQVNTETSNRIVHTVKKGESLGSISKKYGVSVANIKKWNNLKKDVIVPGKKLTIYRSGGPSSSTSSTSKSTSSSSSSKATTTAKTHTVKKGETLSSISRKYGCSVADLKKWNNLKSNTVIVGQKLKIKN